MTAVLEHATLTDMAELDAETSAALKTAADAVENGPLRLRRAIRAASDRGGRPADITRAIGHVYTYDYVAKLVRDHKKALRDGTPEE